MGFHVISSRGFDEALKEPLSLRDSLNYVELWLNAHGICLTQFRHQRCLIIFDNVENLTLADCRRALASDGTLILNSGSGMRGFKLLVRLVKPLVVSPFVRQNLRRYLSVPNHEDLLVLKKLVCLGSTK